MLKKETKKIEEYQKYQKKIQKNPKIKKHKKNQKICKIVKNLFFFQKLKSFEEKNSGLKRYSLFLNFRNMQFDQSSPVQPNPEKKNLEKSF